MFRLLKYSVFALTFSVAALAQPVLAADPGQIEQGDIFRVKNTTQNVDFADPANANACDVLEYKVRIHNPGPSTITNVTVAANLPSGSSVKNTATVTVSSLTAAPQSASDTAVVNLSSSQSIAYVAGSTQLLDANGGLVKTLPDGVTQNGVNVGDVNVSINNKRYVQFQAKVSCPTPAPQVSFACTALDVAQIDRTHYDFTAHGTAQNATIQSYGFTAKDANGTNVDTNTVNTSAASAVYHFNQSNAGTYNVSAVVNTDHGSTNASACSKQITVAAVPTTPTTPTTPAQATALPNTGAGDVLGLFAGASAAGTAAHAVVTRRFRR